MIPFPQVESRPEAKPLGGESEIDQDVEALRTLGVLAREGGRLGRAAALLGRSLRIANVVGDDRQIGEVLRDRGDLRLRQGDGAGAVADWRTARERFMAAGAVREARTIEARLRALPESVR